MNCWFSRFVNSSIGQKYIVGLTGLALVGFLIAHLLGNLLVFAGPDAINQYAAGLRELGGLLWLMRIGLIVVFVLHVVFTIKLAKANRAARPVGYAVKKRINASFASMYMVHSGIVVLAFLLYHLAHYTFLWVQPEIREYGMQLDAYNMVITGFSVWYIALFYIIAMACLMSHLYHGASSFFQSLGLYHGKYNKLFRGLGPVVSIALFLGFSSIPVAILFGIIS